MKQNILRKYTDLASAALLLGSASLSFAQIPDRTINTFDTGTQAAQPSGCGFWYGSGTAGWDGTQDQAASGGGSLYIQTTWGGSDTPLTEYVTLPGDNLWWQGNGTYNLSQYKSIQFDIKWDNSSTVTLAQWNDPSTKPGASLGGSISGLEVDAAQGNGSVTWLITTNIPAAAASGWVHITIPVNATQSGIDPSVGIMFKKWLNGSGSLSTHTNESGVYTNIANFWIDNVILEGTAGPPPPPTVSAPTIKATQGLNVFLSTKGNSFYDRQEIMSRQTSGLAWVGNATPANPVTYSFTINSFPTDPASYGGEAYLFMSPNPGWNPSAPDWNDTNCAIAIIQLSTNGAIMRFQYKADEDNQNAMFGGGTETRGSYTNAPGSWDGVTANYLETGNLGSVTNPTAIGTWTIRFASDTNVTLIAPGGNTSSFVIPAYNASKLGETGNGGTGFNLYLGAQANNEAFINQAVVYSKFEATGVPSAFSEDFLAESVLDTTTTWDTGVAGGPRGVLIVPAGSAYWLTWTLPDSGFGLQTASVLTQPSAWNDLTAGPIVPMFGLKAQLVSTSELPGDNSVFFRLIKREFTQLQLLLAGETNAPNTLTGKTGTPNPVSLTADSGLANVTINAVDSTYHIVSSTDTIQLSSTTDPTAITPLAAALVNGTLTQVIQFDTAGSQTVTATDTTNTNIPPSISASLTVGP